MKNQYFQLDVEQFTTTIKLDEFFSVIN